VIVVFSGRPPLIKGLPVIARFVADADPDDPNTPDLQLLDSTVADITPFTSALAVRAELVDPPLNPSDPCV
jgi:hypothetical protein